MQSTTVLFTMALAVGLLLVGCMGPEVEWVPTTIAIIDPAVSDVTSKTAVVSWHTNHDAMARVVIVDQASVSNTILVPKSSTYHRVELTDLEPGSFYLLVLQNTNNIGGIAAETGAELVFQTLSE